MSPSLHSIVIYLCFTASSLAVTSSQYQFLVSNENETFQISPRAIVSDACASYSTLEKLNNKVKPALDELTQETDFFSYYRLNLFHKKCPFWNDENAMCGNIACAVNTIDNEEDIPKIWRASELSKLEGPSAKHPGKKVQRERPQKPLQGLLGENVGESCVVEYDDECDERDYCVPEDESASGKGDYVSLVHNPERFTGYAGDGAKMVWDAIYRENCFQRSSFHLPPPLELALLPTDRQHKTSATYSKTQRGNRWCNNMYKTRALHSHRPDWKARATVWKSVCSTAWCLVCTQALALISAGTS